ncbi:MAG TPA: FAD-dependent oxidoreductase, partial [Sphingomicrobium sp.]
MAETYDLIILGSGPGGYVAAIRAAQLGLTTAIVERAELGGVCLNWGCIPTKALLRSADVLHQMQHAHSFGLSAGKVGFDLGKVVARSRDVAAQMNKGVTGLMKRNKIAVHAGEGKLTGPGKLTVTADGPSTGSGQASPTELSAKHIIVATGARARELPFAKSDGKRIWTYRHAMAPSEMPTELLVIGSGAIGIEFASFYNDLGAKVTVVEMLDRIVPVEDAEVSRALTKSLTGQGIEILTSAGVESLKADAKGVAAAIKSKDGKAAERRFSHAIVAVGIS